MTNHIREFLATNEKKSSSIPAASSSERKSAYDMSEEDQLQAAIAASMQEEEEEDSDVVIVSDDDDDDVYGGFDPDSSHIDLSESSATKRKASSSNNTYNGDESGHKRVKPLDDRGDDDGVSSEVEVTGMTTNGKEEAEEKEESVPDAPDTTLPPEPEGDAEGCTRVQVRLPDGSQLRRRFLKDDSVNSVFNYVLSHVITSGLKEDASLDDFELWSTFPRKAVENDQSQTIATSQLTNASLLFRWT